MNQLFFYLSFLFFLMSAHLSNKLKVIKSTAETRNRRLVNLELLQSSIQKIEIHSSLVRIDQAIRNFHRDLIACVDQAFNKDCYNIQPFNTIFNQCYGADYTILEHFFKTIDFKVIEIVRDNIIQQLPSRTCKGHKNQQCMFYFKVLNVIMSLDYDVMNCLEIMKNTLTKKVQAQDLLTLMEHTSAGITDYKKIMALFQKEKLYISEYFKFKYEEFVQTHDCTAGVDVETFLDEHPLEIGDEEPSDESGSIYSNEDNEDETGDSGDYPNGAFDPLSLMINIPDFNVDPPQQKSQIDSTDSSEEYEEPIKEEEQDEDPESEYEEEENEEYEDDNEQREEQEDDNEEQEEYKSDDQEEEEKEQNESTPEENDKEPEEDKPDSQDKEETNEGSPSQTETEPQAQAPQTEGEPQAPKEGSGASASKSTPAGTGGGEERKLVFKKKDVLSQLNLNLHLLSERKNYRDASVKRLKTRKLIK